MIVAHKGMDYQLCSTGSIYNVYKIKSILEVMVTMASNDLYMER